MKKQLLISCLILMLSFKLSAQTQHTITMDASDFIPADITIDEGDEILWSNTSSVTHTSTSGSNCTPNNIWNSEDILPGGTFSRIFSTTGTFPYYCTYHCGAGMVGTVTVQEVTGTKNKVESSALKINNLYPNPAENFTILEYSVEKSTPLMVEVVNKMGIVVKTFSVGSRTGVNEVSLDLSDLSSGIYYCFLTSDANKAGVLVSVQ